MLAPEALWDLPLGMLLGVIPVGRYWHSTAV